MRRRSPKNGGASLGGKADAPSGVGQAFCAKARLISQNVSFAMKYG